MGRVVEKKTVTAEGGSLAAMQAQVILGAIQGITETRTEGLNLLLTCYMNMYGQHMKDDLPPAIYEREFARCGKMVADGLKEVYEGVQAERKRNGK